MSVRKIRFLIDVIQRTSELEVAVGIQTAAVDTDSPSNWIAKGVWRSTTGKWCSGMVDISTDVDPAFHVRFGLGSKNTTGTGLERGEVAVAISASDQ